MSINLLHRPLSRDDYLRDNHGSDAKNVLDSMLLHNRYLLDSAGIVDTNQRARTKVTTNARVMPRLLFLTGVAVSIDRENAGSEPVSRENYRARLLTVAHKTRNHIVSFVGVVPRRR